MLNFAYGFVAGGALVWFYKVWVAAQLAKVNAALTATDPK